MIGVGVPIASALVMEQLPKTGVAEVPFAFQVDDQTLPPGTYSVKQADLGRGVRIQNEKGAGIKCVAVKRKFGRAEEARLVFERYDGRYSLAEIWFDAEGRGLILQEKGGQTRSGAQDRGIRYVLFQ
jgi:hypothetical protein